MTSTRARAVRFDRYGGRDVLYLAGIDMPSPGPGEVLVELRAAGINPGEAGIRVGGMHEMFPATFPSGQGSDLAGVVAVVGPDVTDITVGDEVLGFSWRRSSHSYGRARKTADPKTAPIELGSGGFALYRRRHRVRSCSRSGATAGRDSSRFRRGWRGRQPGRTAIGPPPSACWASRRRPAPPGCARMGLYRSNTATGWRRGCGMLHPTGLTPSSTCSDPNTFSSPST